MIAKPRNIEYVVDWRLCVGCGACSYVCPRKNISLVNIAEDGIRPQSGRGGCSDCGECLKVCPGISASHPPAPLCGEYFTELLPSWGPVVSLWEGYAVDEVIRYCGSSGGVASALALYCVEKGGMEGVLHIGPSKDEPGQNSTVFSTVRSEILDNAGSRYSPASPCDSLELIESAKRECVFIGKPCDIAALKKCRNRRPELDEKVGLSIGIFCAGTPGLQGTTDLLDRTGIQRSEVAELRYRGRGWPGMFAVRFKGEETTKVLGNYADTWGFLQKYRPFRCYLCPDSTSEFADISCGDPWYRTPQEGEAGFSLVLVRTSKGAKILDEAVRAGYLSLERKGIEVLEGSQANLLSKRRAIWGRLMAMKLLGIPTPRLNGFHLFQNWCQLSTNKKVRSILGTARRIINRKYYKPAEFRPPSVLR